VHPLLFFGVVLYTVLARVRLVCVVMNMYPSSRIRTDINFATLLQMMINCNAQKPGTEMTLLMFVLKTHPMPYSEWRFGMYTQTLHSDIQAWLSLSTRHETSTRVGDQTVFQQHLLSKQHSLMHLSPDEGICIITLYQYKLWMEQFQEFILCKSAAELCTQEVTSMLLLLSCAERHYTDGMVVGLENTHLHDRPHMTISFGIKIFLHLMHARMQMLFPPVEFDSIKSAADDF